MADVSRHCHTCHTETMCDTSPHRHNLFSPPQSSCLEKNPSLPARLMGRQLRTRCLRWAWCPTRYSTKYTLCVLLWRTPLLSSGVGLNLTSFLTPPLSKLLDVCVRSGELPGSLLWDHWWVYERDRHGNGQGALPARGVRTVSSLRAHTPTHERKHP